MNRSNNRKILPVGQEDFKEIIECNGYYVDKTLLIKKLLETKSKVTLFTRPRRFGKTLNISMLQYFFENTKEKNDILFENFAIMNETTLCTEYMGKFPVIRLSLKSARQESYSYAFSAIKQVIAEEFRRHEEAVQVYRFEQERIRRILNAEGDEQDYLTALQFLSQILYDYYGKKVIVLLDEYDVPLENAYFCGFYDKMVGFIRSLFESVLKTNRCLELAVITGCLRISKESIFTGLNNLRIVSILDKPYEEFFGFTDQETMQLLCDYGLEDKVAEARKWYDGYLFGEKGIYNPWSILNYAAELLENKDAAPRAYWSNTSSNSIIRTLIERADSQVKQKIENLIAGKTIESSIHEDITYADIEKSEDNLWNFLYFTGYLRKTAERFDGEQRYITMQIPNAEISYIYKSKVSEWTKEHIEQEDLKNFYSSLLSGNAEGVQKELGRMLRESISYFDSKEMFYHGFLLGLLVPLKDYLTVSNREAGKGRFDIMAKSLDIEQPAVILELKQAAEFQELKEMAEEGLNQIFDREYYFDLKKDGYENIYCYGISFYKKNCRVVCKGSVN